MMATGASLGVREPSFLTFLFLPFSVSAFCAKFMPLTKFKEKQSLATRASGLVSWGYGVHPSASPTLSSHPEWARTVESVHGPALSHHRAFTLLVPSAKTLVPRHRRAVLSRPLSNTTPDRLL